MKKYVCYIFIILLFIPFFVYADTYSNSLELANNYMLSNTFKDSYQNYIFSGIFYNNENKNLNGGFLSYEEFLITKKNKSNFYSYLYDGYDYWTYTKKDSKRYVISENESLLAESTITPSTRVVEQVKPSVTVVGAGSKQDPWIFVRNPKIKLISNEHGKISSNNCASNVNEIDLTYIGKEIEICLSPKSGYAYVSNTCPNVISDVDNDGKLEVNDVQLDSKCEILFGKVTYEISLDQTNLTSMSSPTKLYLLYSNGWYENKIGTKSITKITPPRRKGYTFLGYYADSTLKDNQIINATGKINTGKTTAFDKNSILYLSMKANKYTVTFNQDNPTKTGTDSVEVEFDKDMPKITVPKREYIVTFNYNGSGKSNTSNTLTFDFDGYVYDEVKYYDKNGNSARKWDVDSSVTLDAVWQKKSIELPTPIRNGFTCTGWYDKATGGEKIADPGQLYIPTKNITLYAQWSANTYNISYNANGGSGSMENSIHTYNVAKALTDNTFVKIGYTFNGWNTKADGSGTNYANKASVKNLSSTPGDTITLYAKWKVNTYAITLNNSGATTAGNASVTATYDKDLPKITIPKKQYNVTFNYNGSGKSNTSETSIYDFNGYFYNNDQYYYNDGTSARIWDIPTNTTLIAKWTAKSIILPYATRTGYLLDGWYTTSSGSEKIGDANSEFIPTKAQTLYAKWNPIKYNIAFNANGGTGSMGSVQHTYNTSKNLPANVFTKVGYAFNGWNTAPDGSGTTYANSASVKNLSSTNGATVTLYAKWKQTKITYAQISNSYSCSNGSAGSAPYIIKYTGKCTLIKENTDDWKIKFTSSGTFTFNLDTKIDVFLVGGGGGSGSPIFNVYYNSAGGGGGYTKTVKNISTSTSSNSVTIGAGGAGGHSGGATNQAGKTGGTSSATINGTKYTAAGGKGGGADSRYHSSSGFYLSYASTGGNGGSGGGGAACANTSCSNKGQGGNGGSYGKNGSINGGTGQGTTTCEFGQGTTSGCNSGVAAYGGGGAGCTGTGDYTKCNGGSAGAGGGGGAGSSGTANTGGGGGGVTPKAAGSWNSDGKKGGSGIVIIRNAR